MFLIVFGLLIIMFTTLPFYVGWLITLILACVLTVIGCAVVYGGNNKGEDGLNEIIMGTIAMGCVWFGAVLAGVIQGIAHLVS